MLGIQSLGVRPLLVLAAVVVVGLSTGARRRWMQLIRRSRWLILLLALTFMLSTPGEALLPGLPGTGEGLLAAAEHGLRFLLILAAVAWLLERCSSGQLMVGLYCLSRPLTRLGYPTDRVVARLALVLDEIEQGQSGRGWRTLLDERPEDVTRTLELQLPALRRRDLGLCGIGVLLLVAAVLGNC